MFFLYALTLQHSTVLFAVSPRYLCSRHAESTSTGGHILATLGGPDYAAVLSHGQVSTSTRIHTWSTAAGHLSPTLTGTHVSHVRPDSYASKPRPSLVSSDQDHGYRIIPWQVWSLRRTVSTVDARFLILNPSPFPSFDPALIRVFCTVGRGVLRMAPRARISTEKPL
jgi:hypothetical protein